MADIFLSYAREDLLKARRYVEGFEKAGWSVFWDPGILPGSDFSKVIERELLACRCVVVLWSKASVMSTWVWNEAHVGEDRGILLPVLIDNVTLPLGLRHRQAVNLQRWKGDAADAGFVQLVQGVASLVPPASAVSAPKARGSRSSAPPIVVALPPRVFRSDAWQLPDEPLLGFIEIPAGEFVMGRSKSDKHAPYGVHPRHRVHLPAFYIGRYPVTVAQFRACVADGGCESKRKSKSLRDDADDTAVRNVSWFEALTYCEWLEAKLKAWDRTPRLLASTLAGPQPSGTWHVTLPSEAEWEKAAGGVNGRVAVWGSLNRSTDAVGSVHGGTSPYGVLDMTGRRIQEWTRSRYEKYPYVPSDGRERLDPDGQTHRAVRGGEGDPAYVVPNRTSYAAEQRLYHVGFRLAISRIMTL